jgi:peptide subunit release factor RF-3
VTRLTSLQFTAVLITAERKEKMTEVRTENPKYIHRQWTVKETIEFSLFALEATAGLKVTVDMQNDLAFLFDDALKLRWALPPRGSN